MTLAEQIAAAEKEGYVLVQRGTWVPKEGGFFVEQAHDFDFGRLGHCGPPDYRHRVEDKVVTNKLLNDETHWAHLRRLEE